MSAYQKEKMSAYQKENISTYLKLKLSTYLRKYINQPSVRAEVLLKKLSNKSLNSSIVKGQVLTNNKDVGIPKRKDISISKRIDVDIPTLKILLQSPIKYNVLSKSQPMKIKKSYCCYKKRGSIQKRKFDNWLGKFNNYKSNRKNELSLPCPAEGCNCGICSNIVDNYSNDVKKSLLLNAIIDKYETQISWNWPDWNYIEENSRNKKQSMNKSIASHFVREIYM